MKNQSEKTLWRLLCFILCAMLFFGASVKVQAAPQKKLTLAQAVSLGYAQSWDYQKMQSKIALKEVKYKEAVKSIQLKKKNMASFRWSPLLNFKFPEKPDLSEEYEFMYKPLQIQSELSSCRHELTDIKYQIKQEVSDLYTEIYTYQEKIAYEKESLKQLSKNLERNQAKLLTGEASQNDVNTIESSITAAQTSLAADLRAFEKAKSDLSEKIGLDITQGYEFLNPYKEANISRSMLENLIQTTLDRSQSYYEAKLATSLALTSVNTNYGLMSRHYGSDMGYISSYVTQAKKGENLNTAAFKLSYDQFLTAVDAPWQGSIKILFIKIPKEWFKGSLDGVRYVEDEPYLLYSNVLEYQEALNDQKSLEKEISGSVRDSFENLVTAKNSYDSLKAQTEKAKKEMERKALKNKAGTCSFEEYEESRKEYEELQIEQMEALKLYTQLLYSFDRLTCGGVTELLQEMGNSLTQGIQGESYVADNEIESAYYYITHLVEDNLFELGIYIPEDLQTEATDFELWVDGIQVGEKTKIGEMLRHLTLALDGTENVFLRLYQDDTFLADCEINPQQYQGELKIAVSKQEEDKKVILGNYTYTLNKKLGLVTFSVSIKESDILKPDDITGFRLLTANQIPIFSEEIIPADQSLTYLSILSTDFSELTIELYGEADRLLLTAKLDAQTKEIYEGE